MEVSVRSRRNVVRWKLRAASILLLALVLPACGGESSGAGGASAGDASPGGSMEKAGGEMAVVESGGQAAAQAASAQATARALPDDFDRKIVKTAELGVRAEDVRESAEEAQRVVANYGGTVLSSRVSRGDGSVYADLTLSVASPDFEAALEELRGLGKKVTTDAVSGEDVTEEFVDLESRERNLLAAEESLLGLYDKAESVGDTLAVERELTNIRGQIEEVQGRIKYLEQRTAYSRITLDIEPVAPPPRPPEPAWNPANVAAEAWGASLAVLQAIATAIISAVVFGWWLVPVPLAAFVWWSRRNRAAGPADPPQVR